MSYFKWACNPGDPLPGPAPMLIPRHPHPSMADAIAIMAGENLYHCADESCPRREAANTGDGRVCRGCGKPLSLLGDCTAKWPST